MVPEAAQAGARCWKYSLPGRKRKVDLRDVVTDFPAHWVTVNRPHQRQPRLEA